MSFRRGRNRSGVLIQQSIYCFQRIHASGGKPFQFVVEPGNPLPDVPHQWQGSYNNSMCRDHAPGSRYFQMRKSAFVYIGGGIFWAVLQILFARVQDLWPKWLQISCVPQWMVKKLFFLKPQILVFTSHSENILLCPVQAPHKISM